MAGRFARVETRRRTRGFLLGLLADLPRKNCWTIAEHAGDPDPHGMQLFLARASWDTDGVRDDLRDYVTTLATPTRCWWCPSITRFALLIPASDELDVLRSSWLHPPRVVQQRLPPPCKR